MSTLWQDIRYGARWRQCSSELNNRRDDGWCYLDPAHRHRAARLLPAGTTSDESGTNDLVTLSVNPGSDP